MSKDEKCTCKACKNAVFHCQICKFVGVLLPSSSWLLKLPIVIGLSFCRSRFKLYVIKVRRIDRWKRQEAKHNQILLIRPELLETWLELASVNYHSSIPVSSNWPQASGRLKNWLESFRGGDSRLGLIPSTVDSTSPFRGDSWSLLVPRRTSTEYLRKEHRTLWTRLSTWSMS